MRMGSEKTYEKCQAAAGFRKDSKPKSKRNKANSTSLTVYWILVILRVFLTLMPQTGYIHPDEYFQTIEIVAADVFDLEVDRPWEFNVTFPIRSILLPKIVYGFPYILLGSFMADFNDFLGWDIRTPYVMLVLPRLIACALSFVTDFCLYKICVLYGQKYRSRLLILATSYVPVVYGTRTLSNSIEMALMSFLLYLVADCMITSDKVIYQEEFLDQKYSSSSSPVERTKLYKMRAALPPHSLRRCFTISTTVVAGIFNRPTFLAFGLAPVFFWLQRGISSKYCGIRAFHIRIFLFVCYAFPALLIFILADSFYYGHLTWDEIGMWDVSLKSFVVTPFNFLLYNSQEKNLAHHGLHPRVTHMIVNIPLLYNILGFTGIVAVFKFFFRASQAKWRELPRAQSLMMLMTASFFIPLLLLSMIPHQEARFLIPVTLPLVFLHAQEIRDVDLRPALVYGKHESIQDKKKSSLNCQSSLKTVDRQGKTMINLWILINFILILFFGFIHQGGIYPLTLHLKEFMRRQTTPQVIHLVTSYTYPLPQSLLVQRNSHHQYFDPITKTKYHVSRKFYPYELGSQHVPDVLQSLKNILLTAEATKRRENLEFVVLLALPSFMFEYEHILERSNLTFVKEGNFYPHMSTEALPFLVSHTSNLLCSCYGLCFKPKDFENSSHSSQVFSEESFTRQVVHLSKQFGLSLYRVYL